MVGALSIVRFRNPVRSPLELCVYFGAITMGITASVSSQWLLMLVFSVLLASMVLWLLNIASLMFLKHPIFMASFSEGNNLSTLNLTSDSNIKELDESRLLTMKSVNDEGITYTLAAANFSEITALEEQIKRNSKVKRYQVHK
jgi:hypothetical protein